MKILELLCLLDVENLHKYFSQAIILVIDVLVLSYSVSVVNGLESKCHVPADTADLVVAFQGPLKYYLDQKSNDNI